MGEFGMVDGTDFDIEKLPVGGVWRERDWIGR